MTDTDHAKQVAAVRASLLLADTSHDRHDVYPRRATTPPVTPSEDPSHEPPAQP